MKTYLLTFLISIIAAVIVALVFQYWNELSDPSLLINIRQTAMHEGRIAVLEVDIENLGVKTAKNCKIQWWPYGFSFPDREQIWPRPMDFPPNEGLTVHFFHVYNEIGTFNSSIIINCDNYVSKEIFHTVNVTNIQDLNSTSPATKLIIERILQNLSKEGSD